MGLRDRTHRGLRFLSFALFLALSWSATCNLVLAQTAALVPNASQQFFNAQGQPLANGSVYFFVPNTTTPKTVWSDQNQTNAFSQPVTLDAGGFPQNGGSSNVGVFGQGNYREQVFDANSNLVFDGFTSAYGSASPSGATGTDTAPVGTVLAFSGFTVPVNWQLAYGQALSRTTFASLLSTLTISTATGNCSATSTTISGFTSTAQIPVGSPIESTCLPTSTTVASIVNATTITVSNAATATGTFTITDFPWGNGDGVTTFNVPDLRGRVIAGPDAMGGTAASRLTSTYYGANASTPAVAGGSQSSTASTTLGVNNIPQFQFTPSGTVSASGTATASFGNLLIGNTGGIGGLGFGGGASYENIVPQGTGGTTVNVSTSGSLAGSQITIGQASPSAATSAAFATIQPTMTTNYIIKVAANTSGAGGVVSIGGMFGDILCGTGIICANQTLSVASTAGTVSSVGLSLPSIFTVTGSPVTTTGTLTATYANESVNSVFAGPSSGSASAPSFRTLVSSDIPPINLGSVSTNGGVTGTLGNAQLTNSSILANGTTCILGGSCTITTAASAVIVSGGSATTITGGSGTGFVISDNAGVLGETSSTTTINAVACVLGSSCSISATAASMTVGTTTIISGSANALLAQSSSGATLAAIASGNNEVLATNGSGVPAFTTTLPSAVQGNITSTGVLTAGSTGAGFTIALGTSTFTGQLASVSGGTGVNAPTSGDIYKGAGSSAMTPSALTDNGTIVATSEPFDLTSTPVLSEIANAVSTGTTLHKLAKLTGAPSTAVITTTTDTHGAIGVVVGSAGTSGSAQIAVSGQASCIFDAATVAGDYVQNSGTVNGDCSDVGASYPTSGQVIGRVLSTNASGGTYSMLVVPPEIDASAGGGSGISSVNLIAGTGMSVVGTCNSTVSISCTINSPWSFSGSSIFNNNAGNVGIGGASPGNQLYVSGANQTTANLTNGGNAGGEIMLFDTGAAAGNGGAVLFGAANGSGNNFAMAAIKGLLTNGTGPVGDLAFATRRLTTDTALTTAMTIDATGNVGIGTVSPGGILQVLGWIIAAPVDCTGATDSRVSLTNAAAQGAHIILPAAAGGAACIYRIASNLTLTANIILDIEPGAVLAPDSGVTLTINGQVHAAACGFISSARPCQTFKTSADGSFGTVVGLTKVYPEWFGAYADDSHDDAGYIQAAFNDLLSTSGSSGSSPKEIIFGCGGIGYLMQSGVAAAIQDGDTWNVHGCTGAGSPPKIVAGSSVSTVSGGLLTFTGTNVDLHISDLSIYGASAGNGYCGILFGGTGSNNFGGNEQNGSSVKNVTVANFSYGQLCFQQAQLIHVADSTFSPASNDANGWVISDTPSFSITTGEIYAANDQFRNCSTCTGQDSILINATNGGIGVAAIHLDGGAIYFYPYQGRCVEWNASNGEIADVWIAQGTQADSETGGAQCYYQHTSGTGVIWDTHIDHTYWTVLGGTPAWFYAPILTNTNALFITNNYLNTSTGCSTPIGVGSSGSGITIADNQLFGACSGGTEGIFVGGQSGSPTSNVVISGNLGIEVGSVTNTFLADVDWTSNVAFTGNMAVGYSTNTGGPIGFTGNTAFHNTAGTNCNGNDCGQ